MATEPDAVNTGALGTLITVGVFTMIGTCLVVNALVRAEKAENESLKAVDATAELRDVQKKQQAIIGSGPGIDRQMKGVLEQLRRDPNSASPPPPPKPAPTAADADGGVPTEGDAGAAPEAAAPGAAEPEKAAPAEPTGAKKTEMRPGAERGKSRPPRNPGTPNPHRAPGG